MYLLLSTYYLVSRLKHYCLPLRIDCFEWIDMQAFIVGHWVPNTCVNVCVMRVLCSRGGQRTYKRTCPPALDGNTTVSSSLLSK